ncbi:MAG: hypothetical protein IN808_06720 [Rubrobacter sp.]|nr:hypothetical protein [Rubrobacter sp.]
MAGLYAAGAGAFAAIRGGRAGLSLEGVGAGCLAVDPEDPDLVYAGTGDEGVFRSTDGGRSWQDRRPGALADCHALAAHPAAPGLAYEAGGGRLRREPELRG